jgi:GT2 family glycosyltransferase
VIIPSRERPQLVRECVGSILAGDRLPHEIVVVDQSRAENRWLADLGSVDGCRVLYRHSSATGVSAARNEGSELAGQEILVFTDDDIVVAPDWLGTIFRAASDRADSELISGRVRSVDTPGGGFAPSLIDDDSSKVYEGRIWTDVLFSGNMAFSRSIFDRLGQFDTRLGAGGRYLSAADNDYCFRALEAGYRIRYAPDAIVYHQAWRKQTHYPRLMWRYGVGQGAYLTKHVRLSDRYTLMRLRDALVFDVKAARYERAENPLTSKALVAHALGLVYGSARWTLLERLRGR